MGGHTHARQFASAPCGAQRGPAEDDAIVESAVLGFVIYEHPCHLTIPELSLTLGAAGDDPGRGDAIERAVRGLVGAGLLHVAGGLVVPSRAALRFMSLDPS